MKTWAFGFVATSLVVYASAAVVGRESIEREDASSYDFIIVGGGTAGLAVASRISIDLPNYSVLVIEAGPDGRQEPGITIPGRKGSTLGGKYDWNLTTVAQPSANNRVFSQNRGKVLGGSSALNLMTWDRTSVAELDAWEKLGNKGWNWKSLYPAMLKAEMFLPSPEYGNQGVGKTGPIKTLINRIFPRHQSSWIPTMNNLGLATNRESLNGNPIGVSTQPGNVNPDYTRSYAPEYLKLAKKNLVLKLETRVAKVNFIKGGTATGVTLENGTVLNARKEVILSAGSFQTPGLLELSGIGNANLLKQLGIPVVVDLPSVGENFQDHIRIQASFQLKPEYPSFDVLRNTTRAAAELALYNSDQVSLYDYTASGYSYFPWSVVSKATSESLRALVESDTSLTSAVDKVKKSYFSPAMSAKVPQLEVIFSDGYTGVKGYPAANSSLFGIGTFALIGVVQHPLSKGNVHITSRNISVKPAINPNYLSHPYDLQAATNLAKFLRTIASAKPMSDLWTEEYEPGKAVQTDEDWKKYALANTLSIYHPIGTCALLPRKDGGVVDEKLQVYGTKKLRVVDASIIPLLPSAHIQTLVYGIAEKAAGMIIEAHK
ncbi:choline dehydrogenase mitochondrial precursor [Ophiobolus disseminans]|uniref:Choline dehydrogenase mitochondrial n=1 Tax=Ophiobolus disseminans TaxID=1469910 RepID=A0A6A6ZQT1_9PLEO|nr:choline dehydrogenase mitochondrial precursor [Ophiobolus disseminans]